MRARSALAFVLVALWCVPALAQEGGGEREGDGEGEAEGGGEAERPDDASVPPPGRANGPSAAGLKASKRRRGKRPRVSGYVMHEADLRKRLPPPPSGNLYLHRPIEKESLKVNIFNPDGSYNVDAIKAASHMLRCRRTDTEKEMEPRLLAILSHVFDHFGERRIDLISGYRNQRKTSSYHYKGTAADIRIEGVPARKLRAFIETLDAGGMGIGIYPVTGFVHVDVRPPPSYRWTDYSPSNPGASQKKPPKWFKKRRLTS